MARRRSADSTTLSSEEMEQNALRRLGGVHTFPAGILGNRSLQAISLKLDPDLPCVPNWRFLAEIMTFNEWEIKKFERESWPAASAIRCWCQIGYHTVKELIYLVHEVLGRRDIFTDDLLIDSILNDARRSRRCSGPASLPSQQIQTRKSSSDPFPPVSVSSFPSFRSNSSSETITPSDLTDDILNPSWYNDADLYRAGSVTHTPESYSVSIRRPPHPSEEECFDAYVLYNISDRDFMLKFISEMEEKRRMRLYIPDRDGSPGQLSFTDRMNDMLKRCRRIVAILSDEFLRSDEGQWAGNLALSHNSALNRERVIPVIYKSLATDTQNFFRHLVPVDFTNSLFEEWGWRRLSEAIKRAVPRESSESDAAGGKDE